MENYLRKVASDQTFLTILSGTFVYILSQFFMELIIVPRKNYKRIIGQIIFHVKMYSFYYLNPYDLDNVDNNIRSQFEYEHASNEIRKVGAELSSYLGDISWFRFKRRKRLLKVQDALINLADGFFKYNDKNPINNNKNSVKIIEDNV